MKMRRHKGYFYAKRGTPRAEVIKRGMHFDTIEIDGVWARIFEFWMFENTIRVQAYVGPTKASVTK